jgi:hypothetical protein
VGSYGSRNSTTALRRGSLHFIRIYKGRHIKHIYILLPTYILHTRTHRHTSTTRQLKSYLLAIILPLSDAKGVEMQRVVRT